MRLGGVIVFVLATTALSGCGGSTTTTIIQKTPPEATTATVTVTRTQAQRESRVSAHRVLGTVGLSLNLLGAYLVAVEAIKLNNFKRVATWYGRARYRLLRLLPAFMGARTTAEGAQRDETVRDLFRYYWRGVRVRSRGHNGGRRGKAYALGVGLVLLGVVWWLLFGLASFGIWALTQLFIGLPLKAIELIDAHTESGGVGIVGVRLLTAGFSCDLVAVWS